MQKYRVLLVGIAILAMIALFSTSLDVIAQAEETGWPIVESCMSDLSYPILPRSKWDFEGVIFSSNSEGIRAIRSDFDTSYFVALDSDTSFAFEGTFSPDGKWFAYPLGTTEYATMISDLIAVRSIQIVSTDPAQLNKYNWPLEWLSISFSGVTRGTEPIFWIDEDTIIYRLDLFNDPIKVVNIYTGDVESVENAEELYEMADRLAVTAHPFWRQKIWFSDVPQYVSTYPSEIFDDKDQALEIIAPQGGTLAVSPNSNLIALKIDDRLALADRENRVIYDLCFSLEGIYSTFIFSPDGQKLAFTFDLYPVIIDLQTMSNTILDYQTDYLLAWFPTE
jgi:roadblock/LC7 domain-containing protein